MRALYILLLSLPISAAAAAQADKSLVKDLDADGRMDTVRIDEVSSVIVCRLSSQGYKAVKSVPIEVLNDQSGLAATRNGFEFYNHWMRAGYKNQFRYDARVKKMRLIGMSRYEFGPASGDGSGASSVNLLTGDYIGDWNYYDMEKDALVRVPTIKAKMRIAPVYLETFGEDTYMGYAARCSELYHERSSAYRKAR